LTETISRPIYLLSESDSAPELLKTILKSVEIPSNEVLQSISEEIIVEFAENFSHISDTYRIKAGGFYKIYDGLWKRSDIQKWSL